MPEQLLEAIEIETGSNPTASVIWMHGLGADGNDFVPVAQELGLPQARPVRFIFPHAPMQPVTINNGYVMRAWYDISLDDLEGGSKRADENGVRASQAAIGKLVAREAERGISFKNIVLAGFSQGGAVALQTGLRYPQQLAGVMALSAYLPLADSLPQEASPANQRTPLFMAHGLHDPVVPYAMGSNSKVFLEKMGYRVEWHDYPMQHSVSLEEIQDIGIWLKRVLAP
ncbi:MAG: alpha/beta hydrolase-fold protein [Burkholderiales bacterium]|nr:alpha/beta hydrolase-fold protein [Burkholderiales bacterium]